MDEGSRQSPPRKKKTTQSRYALRIPPDLSPADVLEVVVGLCQEMRHPINKVEDWAVILADPDSADLHPQAVQEILQWVDGMRYIMNIVYAYDAQRPKPE
jgi:hypothetical protein